MKKLIQGLFMVSMACSPVVFSANIHEMLISTGQFEGVDIDVWTSVGIENLGMCDYKKETARTRWTVYKTIYLYLNSETLKSMVSLGYTCAKTNVQKATGGRIYDSPFRLILNEEKTDYINTDPYYTSLWLGG